MSSSHDLKKLQYDGKDIVSEVAVRDDQGRIISSTYVDKTTDQTIIGCKRFDTTPQIFDHYEITTKNLFRKNFNIFDNTGGTGTLYAYFKLPNDGKDYTLSVRLKDSTKSFGSVNVFGWTGNGGNFGGAGGWLAMGDTIQLEKHVFYANDNARFISLYQGNEATFNKLLDRYYIQLEEGTTMTEYVDPDSGVKNIYVDVAKVNDIPTNVSQLTNDLGYITSSYHDNTKANQSSLNEVTAKIPSAADSNNQLADKAFVNSSIETATATFKGTYTTIAAIEALTADDNDYAFYQHVDSDGNTLFDRYKYNGTQWLYEYTLNNSSFTAAQWAAMNSGVSADAWVNTSSAQVIDGQKDFNTTPRVRVTHEIHNLPDAYREVEYIESDGTQYIDSNYIPNANTKIIFDSIMGVNGISGDIRQGRHGDSQRLSVAIVSNKLEFAIGGYQSVNLNVTKQRHLFELDVPNRQGKLDDIIYATFSSTTWTSEQTLYFFGRHMSSGVDGLGNTRNYNIKIYEQDQLIREYIPCYRIADDVIGMYDIINDVFYINAGTETFTKGPDITPVTYESLLTDANFSPVAFSGNYNELINKPTIPTVNNGTLTIQQNGSTITTFGANQSTNSIANITVPTKTSDLTNDSGFVTADSFLKNIPGYDAAKTQTLKNINGTFAWVDD